MRKLILKMSVSIDGFVAGPNGESDWMAKSRSPEGAAWLAEKMMARAGAQLIGRKTFQAWAGFWPTAGGPFAKLMNEVPKIVFSRTGCDPSIWAGSRVLTGEFVREITELKKQSGKDLIAQGGIEFAQNLVAAGLVDEYWLATHPVALGRGISLFARLEKPLDLKLEESKTFATGAMVNIYHLLA